MHSKRLYLSHIHAIRYLPHMLTNKNMLFVSGPRNLAVRTMATMPKNQVGYRHYW